MNQESEKAFFGNSLNLWQPVGGMGSVFTSANDVSPSELYQEYRFNSIVRSNVDKNANAVSEAAYQGLSVKRQKGKELEDVVDHPVIALLETVNETLNAYDLWHLTSRNLDVLGKCYWKLNLVGGNVASIDILPSHAVKPLRDGNGITYAYEYKPKATEAGTRLEVEEVVAFVNHALHDPYGCADSPLMAAIREVRISDAWTDYQEQTIKNRRRPDYVLTPKVEGISDDERKRYETLLNQRVGGKNNGSPIVLDQAFSITPLSFSPIDLAPLEIQKTIRKAVCNALGIPPALDDETANRANMEASLKLWAMQTIAPRLRKIEQVLNASIMKRFDDGCWIEFENVIPADEEQERKNKETADKNLPLVVQAKAITVNELRAAAGLPPVAGGDALIEAPEPPQPPAAPQPQEQPPQQSGDAEDEEDEADDGKALDALLRLNAAVAKGDIDRATAISVAAKTLKLTDDEAKRLITHAPKAAAPAPQPCSCGSCRSKGTAEGAKAGADDERRFAAEVKAFFAKQRAEVLARLGDGKSLDPLDNIAGALRVARKALPDDFVRLEKWDEELAKVAKPYIELFAGDSGKRTIGRIGASPSYLEVIPAKIREGVGAASLRFAESTNATTTQSLNDALSKLRDELTQGLLEGDSVSELKKRVHAIFDNAEAERAELIAQTESMRAVHRGQQIAAEESGIVKGFKLLVSDDACPLCLSHKGKEIGLKGKFNEADSYDDSPLPIHPGCRCTMLEVLKDEGDN